MEEYILPILNSVIFSLEKILHSFGVFWQKLQNMPGGLHVIEMRLLLSSQKSTLLRRGSGEMHTVRLLSFEHFEDAVHPGYTQPKAHRGPH